ncbi:MAG: Nramp family divalent metal transporter [Chloroflexi bacterium]|nr:Nramp family divalent metal transporter [Chloroflexota bacterium]
MNALRLFWKRLKPYRIRLALMLAVVGPGIITANVDNDAGGITTYSVAGGDYGYSLLWMMPFVLLALIIVQEMCARLGVVTGKGLADLIRESMGVRLTTLILSLLVFVNLANTVSEFAGVAASMEIFGVSKFVSVPLAAIGVWLLVYKGDYKTTERVFLIASSIYLAYIASGYLAHPDWGEVGKAFVTPNFKLEVGYVTLFVTIIGTTIAPWMQFYQQASLVDKGIRVEDYKYEIVDVVVGSIFAVIVAAFIVIACGATIHKQGIMVESAKDAAIALGPLAGKYAQILFALGLLNASLFSAAILPLSTAYSVCEAFGWESSLSSEVKDAKVFFTIYTALIVLGASIILLPIKSLIQAMMASQTLNGILLPVILITMLHLINNRQLMGKYTMSRWLNIVAWITAIILIILAVILLILSIFPGLFR